MERLSFYFRQKVTAGELNEALDNAEDADTAALRDSALTGVVSGMAVTAQSSPNMTVQIGQGVAYDHTGLRINIPSTQTVNCAQDESAVSTTVLTTGNEKYLSIFVVADRVLSDPRTDGNSQTVYFRQGLTYRLRVVQGAESPAGTAVAPSLDPDAILLADVLLPFGAATVTNGMISVTRRQDVFTSVGTARTVRTGTAAAAVASLNVNYNNHVLGLADAHPGTTIAYGGGGNWKDGTTNPATTVEAQLDKIVSDLATNGGAAKISTAGAGIGTWANGDQIAYTSIQATLNDLAASLGTGDAPMKIAAAGQGVLGLLGAGSLRSQLNDLDKRTAYETTPGAEVYARAKKVITVSFPNLPILHTINAVTGSPGSGNLSSLNFIAKANDTIEVSFDLLINVTGGISDFTIYPNVATPTGGETSISYTGDSGLFTGDQFTTSGTYRVTWTRTTLAPTTHATLPYVASLVYEVTGTTGNYVQVTVRGYSVKVLRDGDSY